MLLKTSPIIIVFTSIALSQSNTIIAKFLYNYVSYDGAFLQWRFLRHIHFQLNFVILFHITAKKKNFLCDYNLRFTIYLASSFLVSFSAPICTHPVGQNHIKHYFKVVGVKDSNFKKISAQLT